MSMIERVAQAMCVRALGSRQCPCIQSGQFNCRDTFPWDQAKAAIEAMREPSIKMLDAVCCDDDDDKRMIADWQTMIDEALKGD